MRVCALFAAIGFGLAACYSPPMRTIVDNDIVLDEEAAREWKEMEAKLPAAPRPADLAGFYVSPTTSYRFSLDTRSISVGGDRVIRYTLVGVSSGGAKNVSYEGIRCETHERKVYAIGRTDGSWAAARRSAWEPIYESDANRQHSALAKEIFCPDLTVPKDAKEILKRLERPPR